MRRSCTSSSAQVASSIQLADAVRVHPLDRRCLVVLLVLQNGPGYRTMWVFPETFDKEFQVLIGQEARTEYMCMSTTGEMSLVRRSATPRIPSPGSL